MTKRLFCLLVAAAGISTAWAQPDADGYTAVNLTNLSAFNSPAANWSLAGKVSADRNKKHDLQAQGGTGVLVNRNTAKDKGNLVSSWEHGDIDLEVEVLVPAGSNSGIYLMSRYEVQILDSWGVANPAFSDMGGIYQRWNNNAPTQPIDLRGYDGKAPSVNAAKAPGLWQKLYISFQAPRFDANGKKVSNAKFLKVVLNGTVIHTNAEVTGPTRGAASETEVIKAPLLIQGDHGPVAFRNIRYKAFNNDLPALTDAEYQVWYGPYKKLDSWAGKAPDVKAPAKNLSMALAGAPDDYAFHYKGKLNVAQGGTYKITTGAEGKARVIVNGATVLDTNLSWKWWSQHTAQVQLKAGANAIEYIVFKSNPKLKAGLQLALESGTLRKVELHASNSIPDGSPAAPVLLDAQAHQTVQRCFISHQKKILPYALAVGQERGPHFAYNLHSGAIIKGWRGGFADMQGVWHERGSDQLLWPQATPVEWADRPVLARLDNGQFPDTLKGNDFRYLGYDLDAQGYATMRYEVQGVMVTDQIRALADGRGLRRTVTATGNLANQYLRLGSGTALTQQPDGSWLQEEPGSFIALQPVNGKAPKVETKAQNGLTHLLMPLSGQSASVTYDLLW